MSAADSSFRLPLIVSMVLVLLGLGHCYLVAERSSGIDYFHLWAVPEMAQSSQTSIYDAANHPRLLGEFQRLHGQANGNSPASDRLRNWLSENKRLYKTGLHPTGSPFFYAANGFFRSGNVETDFWVFQTVSTLVFVLGIWLFGLSCGAGNSNSLLFAAAFLFLHRGLESDVGVANVNRIQIGLFGLATWFFSRYKPGEREENLLGWFVGSLILGVATAYKPNVFLAQLLVCIALAVDKQWKCFMAALAGFLVGCIAAMAAGALYFGTADIWWQWREYLNTITQSPFDISAGNYAVWPLLLAAKPLQMASLLSTLAVTGIFCAILWKSRLRAFSGPRYILAAAAGLAIPLVTAPVTWGHYFVLSIPLAMALLILPYVNSATSTRLKWSVGCGWIGLVITGLVPFGLIRGVIPEVILCSIQLGLMILLVCAAFMMTALRVADQARGRESRF